MNTPRCLMVAAVAMLGATWAQAQNVPGHYDLILTGWDAGQFFDALPFSDPDPNAGDAFGSLGLNTSDFTNPDDFCAQFNDCIDPGFKFNNAGNSMPEDGPFSFSTGDGNQVVVDGNVVPNGGFENAGAPIYEVIFALTDANGNPIQLPTDQQNEVFQCSSDIFSQCGFTNDGFDVAFWNPIGGGVGIPTATTPEPSESIILLLAFGAVVVARARKANCFFAETQR